VAPRVVWLPLAAGLLLAACGGSPEIVADRMPEPIVIPAVERSECGGSTEPLREEIARLRQRNLRLEVLVEALRREGAQRLVARVPAD
jgi:hypothetical protein